MSREKISKRFWSKVQVKDSDECWPWEAAVDGKGYGAFGVWEQAEKAHRIAYWLTYGTLSYDKVIRHTCDNPGCCNPAHLVEGTCLENTKDMIKRGRKINGGHPNARFYAGEIWLIRKLRVVLESRPKYTKYKFSATYVAKMFKVYPPTILDIWNSKEYLCKEGYYV